MLSEYAVCMQVAEIHRGISTFGALLQFENLLLHDHHIPGVGSAVEDGLLVETAYNKNNKIIIKLYSLNTYSCMYDYTTYQI